MWELEESAATFWRLRANIVDRERLAVCARSGLRWEASACRRRSVVIAHDDGHESRTCMCKVFVWRRMFDGVFAKGKSCVRVRVEAEGEKLDLRRSIPKFQDF